MLSAHDEDLAGPWQPYPAAVQLGQLPCTVPPVMPKDEDIVGLQDSVVGRGASCLPVHATDTASTGSPVAGFSLADLHLGRLTTPCALLTSYHMFAFRFHPAKITLYYLGLVQPLLRGSSIHLSPSRLLFADILCTASRAMKHLACLPACYMSPKQAILGMISTAYSA